MRKYTFCGNVTDVKTGETTTIKTILEGGSGREAAIAYSLELKEQGKLLDMSSYTYRQIGNK